ncbi:hypothetical protein OSTOST_13598, partial [Ostertagia ostertagi]
MINNGRQGTLEMIILRITQINQTFAGDKRPHFVAGSECRATNLYQLRVKVSAPKLFRGVVEKSKSGTKSVIRYSYPGSTLCYIFEHAYAKRRGCGKAARTLRHYEARSTTARFPPRRNALSPVFEPNLHIYYSARTVEKACQLGLWALVADGVHDLQPKAICKTGKLYTVHGVVATSVDFPLLYAITVRKTQAVDERIFKALKDAIMAVAGPQPGEKETKRLKKKAVLRRRQIVREMAPFKSILRRDRAFLRTATITTYCRRMAIFVTEK